MPRASEAPAADLARDRLLAAGPRALSDAELVALLLGKGAGKVSAHAAAVALLEAVPLAELAGSAPSCGGVGASPGGREICLSVGPHDPAGAKVAS